MDFDVKGKFTKADDMLENEFFGRKKKNQQFIKNIQENGLSKIF